MKILMKPNLDDVRDQESGIKRVIEAYYKYLPLFGVELVDDSSNSYDLKCVHAGMLSSDCDVTHLHGLYWTADYDNPNKWEYKANQNIVESLRVAKVVTVPSEWVAETLRRDMHLNPFVIPHGIESKDWEHNYTNEGFVLWNKNRSYDVCSTDPLKKLAKRFGKTTFVSTFTPDSELSNIKVTGVIEHSQMKQLVQKCGVYLSTTKETFGIGILEAMASGKPILGFDYGGNSILVKHKVNGYLAEPDNYEDLYVGLAYCLANKEILGKNSIVLSKLWTWESAVEKLVDSYSYALNNEYTNGISIVIPHYNYPEKVHEAIRSVLGQTVNVDKIVVVDDGSKEKPDMSQYKGDDRIVYIEKNNAGVAEARNTGIKATNTKYVCCLDADDRIAPTFVEVCLSELNKDKSLGIAYTGLMTCMADGKTSVSEWPGEFDYDAQVEKHNQIPTCCVFKREMFDRTGGYKSRYCPLGAGVEDAELWLRAGSLGYNAKKVTPAPLFLYSYGTGNTTKKDYFEVDWTQYHPWTKDKKHPFASIAKPSFLSHKVRQYDKPVVSVIIPVGVGHEGLVKDAIDSVESQTFRRWECIVVYDGDKDFDNSFFKEYPYVKFIKTKKPMSGPGVARNMGVKISKAPFVMFLDADDYLMPDCINSFVNNWKSCDSIVYSDYYGKSYYDPERINEIKDRIIFKNPKTDEYVLKFFSANYDCEKAQMQPVKGTEPFHWCLVTCLIPKKWHEDIGGFDESMKSWEDVDYHWRMARKGYPYYRVKEHLMVYRFSTGNRREYANPTNNRQVSISLLEYMKDKKDKDKIMPCRGCGNTSSNENTYYVRSVERLNMSDENFVLIVYKHPNTGDHQVFGGSTHINYGYRASGDQFLVHINDIASQPMYFSVVSNIEEAPKQVEVTYSEETNYKDGEIKEMKDSEVELTSRPVLSQRTFADEKKFNLYSFLQGSLVDGLKKDGLVTPEDFLKPEAKNIITSYDGIGNKKADKIIEYAKTFLKQ